MFNSVFFFLKNHRLPVGILSITYCMLTFLYLINWGIYWDDWWLISLTDSDMWEMFRQTGVNILGGLHFLFRKSVFPVATYRLALFICGYITLISIYYIFIKKIIKSKYWSFWATVFFAAIPLNFAKITLICFPYVLCSTFFFLAFAVALFDNKTLNLRLIALFLFFMSFWINSLVLFYAIFLLALFGQSAELKNLLYFKSILIFLKSNWDFILLPVTFVLLKYLVFPRPYGEYIGYNSVTISLKVLPETLLAFTTVLNTIITRSTFSGISLLVFLLSSISFAVFYYQKKEFRFDQNFFTLETNIFLKLLVLSITSILISIIPYTLVGRVGVEFGQEWQDRDTLLLPFGYALFFIVIILYTLSSRYLESFKRLLAFFYYAVPLIFFCTFFEGTIKFQSLLLKDSIKQDVILHSMKFEKSINDYYTFYFKDACPQFNIYERIYRSYELNGMGHSIFGNQKRFFVTTGKLEDACPAKAIIGGICKDWQRSSSLDKRFIIEQSPNHKLTSKRALKLAFLRHFNRDKYNEDILHYFTVKLLPPSDEPSLVKL